MPPPYLGGYQQPGYPPPGGPYPPPGMEQGPPPVSGLAVAALIVGLVLPCLGLFIAVPLAIVALVRISKGRNTGKWLAIGGIVAAVLWLVGFIVLAVVLEGQKAERDDAGHIVKAGTLAYGDIRVGDCLVIPSAGEGIDADPSEIKGTPCDEAHNAQSVGVFSYGVDKGYPGGDQLQDDSEQTCVAAATPYVRANRDADLMSYRVIPNESVWDSDGGDRVVCFVTNTDFSDLTSEVVK